MPLTRRTPARPEGFVSNRRRQRSHTTLRKIERRSATRPRIIESWRKTLRHRPQTERSRVPLPTARVDVWVTHSGSLCQAKSCLALLTEGDEAYLARLHIPAVRMTATAARVLLRLGLSRAVSRSIAPSEWRFETTEQGKPVVAKPFPDLKFSVSHVDQLAVVAISPSLTIGIDAESIDQSLSPDIVHSFCHSDEQISLGNVPVPQRTREFIRLWTLKEAYTKMIGGGHSVDFTWIKFMLDPVNLQTTNDVPHKRTLFENFYVTARHSLYHASLAMEDPPGPLVSTEIQIISLADPTGLERAIPAPLSD
jgi:phosphopantetheinyl transferase